MASDITADKGRVAEAKTSSLIDNVDAYQDTEVRKVISRKDLWKCAIRGLFMEGNFNFERMQGGRFCVFDYPGITKNPR
ncbi:PTS system mannose/fructose/sorbose family IID component [Salmonella enterica subsp. arizonae]|nr:PTS system mannose/fructose/sorbose family IID component [Salmonella enterica subsp. arizonae]